MRLPVIKCWKLIVKNVKLWVGQTECLYMPDLDRGCQSVTFDLELGPCSCVFWCLGLPASMILFSQGLHKCLSSSFWALHLAPGLPIDYLELRPSQVSDVLPIPTLFILLPREHGVFHTPGQYGLGRRAHADECMFNFWKNSSVFFLHPYYRLTSHSVLCDLLRMYGRVSTVVFLPWVRVPGPTNHCEKPQLFAQSWEVSGIIGFYEHAFPWESDYIWEVASEPITTWVSLGQNSHQIWSLPRAVSSYRNKNWYLLEILHWVPQSSESPMDTENCCTKCCCTKMKLAFWEVEWLAQGHTINMKVMEVGGETLSVWLQSSWVNRKKKTGATSSVGELQG